MEVDYVIIGGGVAGLAAAIRLTELGLSPLIIEAGSYPAHKMCGEFLAPSCLAVLEKWGIEPHFIDQINFSTNHKRAEFLLPKVAGALSHSILDPLLLQKALQGNASIYTNCRLLHLMPATADSLPHSLQLEGGKMIQARQLIIATGRVPGLVQKHSPAQYIGIKAHFSGVPLQNALEMFFFKGAYLGLAPLGQDVCNVACLAQLSVVERHATTEAFINSLLQQNRWLKSYLGRAHHLFDSWLAVKVPHFGCRALSPLPNVYFIGDAAGTIPPVTGNGLAMSIASGLMAAEYAYQKDAAGYKKAWQQQFTRPILWGRMLHQLLIKQAGASLAVRLTKSFPRLFHQCYQKTR